MTDDQTQITFQPACQAVHFTTAYYWEIHHFNCSSSPPPSAAYHHPTLHQTSATTEIQGWCWGGHMRFGNAFFKHQLLQAAVRIQISDMCSMQHCQFWKFIPTSCNTWHSSKPHVLELLKLLYKLSVKKHISKLCWWSLSSRSSNTSKPGKLSMLSRPYLEK